MNNRRKFIIILFSGIIIGLISVLLILRNDRPGLNIILTTVPSDAQLTFQDQNGNSYTSKKKNGIKLPVGSYDVTATKEGFKERKLKLEVKKDGQKFVAPLQAESDKAKEWAEKNQKKYLDAEKIAGEENQKAGEKFRFNNPILSKLPYSQGFYKIDYGQDGDNAVIYITADQPVGRILALETIRGWGYEPANFDIRFYNLDNPFKVGDENE